MPVAHLRVCDHCEGRVRWAPCSTVCRVGADTDPTSWRDNLQADAGTTHYDPETGERSECHCADAEDSL